jgi:hypothetical protein
VNFIQNCQNLSISNTIHPPTPAHPAPKKKTLENAAY